MPIKKQQKEAGELIKMITNIMKYIPCLVLLFSLYGCNSNPSKEEKLRLYNDVLDQIIDDNYYYHCIDADEEIERIFSDFLKGKISESIYLRISDSLKVIRKNTLPKCKLDYVNEFQIFRAGHGLNDEDKFLITEILKDTSIIKHFTQESSFETIVDTLSQTAQLNAKDLIVSYLEIVPYVKRANRPFGDGMGVFSFSRIYFNKEVDKAILFYEFNCGPKCGTGRVVIVVKENNKWKVEKYSDVWNS